MDACEHSYFRQARIRLRDVLADGEPNRQKRTPVPLYFGSKTPISWEFEESRGLAPASVFFGRGRRHFFEGRACADNATDKSQESTPDADGWEQYCFTSKKILGTTRVFIHL